jgi:hypothetical protein
MSGRLTKERLDEVVEAIKATMAEENIRAVSQRAVQGKVWHLQPVVAAYLSDLRKLEESVRSQIMKRISALVYHFHEYTLDATLARAGVISDDRVHAGSSLDKANAFDLFCLDSKERLYMILKQYGWLEEFFRQYPLHFYENSFTFVDRIPNKKLPIKVKVVGLGIGGSMLVSGLAKNGVSAVTGYEKRADSATDGVGSRYQNASWRAYDIAGRMLDDEAYNHLINYRQKINVNYDDGTTGVIISDRVQIILGNAIDTALQSAKRYGANLVFECKTDDFFREEVHDEKYDEDDEVDIVALFAGAHTSKFFPGLSEEMGIMEWPDLTSACKIWLRIEESEKKEDYCARGGETGAEKWHYTIESARKTPDDVERIKNNLIRTYEYTLKKMGDDADTTQLTETYQAQMAQLDKVMAMMEDESKEEPRFDYIFTNAPDNEHNKLKRIEAGEKGTVVLDSGYNVDVKIATKSIVGGTSKSPAGEQLMKKFSSKLVLTGGDACVNPNPLAAYGATLACQAADMVVQLAVGQGHLKAILMSAKDMGDKMDSKWVADIEELKDLLADYYDARSNSENYFQFVQTLICNLYSLPSPV